MAQGMIFDLARPLLFKIDPELAHRLTVRALAVSPRAGPPKRGPLAVEVAGLHFPNPLGMAAGFDKDAEVPDQLLGLGFGFAEVGSITPRPQVISADRIVNEPPTNPSDPYLFLFGILKVFDDLKTNHSTARWTHSNSNP